MNEINTPQFEISGHAIDARPLEPGLYLVATPIGNLGDITLRALETLASADILACEDTRVTRKLLERYAIRTRPYAYHDHNAEKAGAKLMESLKNGKSVALVSDAGTPLISDPGYRLSQLAIAEGIKVVPIPGASAPLAALVGAGLPNDAFFFAGFPPSKNKGRRDRFAELSDVPATLIFFESPHRIGATLEAAADVLGTQRRAAVCRELTKTYEEFRRGTLGELAQYYCEGTVKGEVVLVISPPLAPDAPSEQDIQAVLNRLVVDMPAAKAASMAAKETGVPRKELYQRLLDMKDDNE